METIALEPVDAVTVTTLVDNVADLLLPDEGPATRVGIAQSVAPDIPARFLEPGKTGDSLRAEHGFSCLVTVEKDDRTVRILFDAGLTPDGMIENMRRLEISPQDIDIVVLSHGHWDHTTGMDGFVKQLGRANMPVLIHPDFWSRRRIALPTGAVELPSTSKPALEGAGFEVVENTQPSFLLDGSLLVTGEVDRTTEFEQGHPLFEAYRDGHWQPDPLILDDQALVANVRGPRPGRPDRLRPLGDREHPPLRQEGHRRGPDPRGDRRLPPRAGCCSRRSSRRPAPRSRTSRPTTSCPRTAPAGRRRTRSRPPSPTRSSRTASAPGLPSPLDGVGPICSSCYERNVA